MATKTIQIPQNFITSMNQFMASVQKMQQLTTQLQQTTQRLPAAQNLYRAHTSVTSNIGRLLQVLRKTSASFLSGTSRIMTAMGPIGRIFLRGLAVTSTVIGGIIGVTLTVGAFAVSAAFAAGAWSKWLWNSMVNLGDSMLQDFLQASGTLSTIGGIRAFGAAFGRLPEDPGILPNIAQARGSVASRQSMALQLLGVKRAKDTADIAVYASLAAARFMKSQARGNELAMAEAFGLTSIFSPQYLIALRNIDEKELLEMERLYEVYKDQMKISDKAKEGWIEFSLMVKGMWAKIETVIANELANPNSDFTKALSDLSKSFVHFFQVLAKAPIADAIIKRLGHYINEFSVWLKKPETDEKIKNLIKNIKDTVNYVLKSIKLLKQMVEIWLGPQRQHFYGRRGLAERVGLERPPGAPPVVPGIPISRYPGRQRFTERIGHARPPGAPPISPAAPIDRYPGRKRFHEKIGIEQPPTAPRISPRPVRPGSSPIRPGSSPIRPGRTAPSSKGGGTESAPVKRSSSSSVNSAIDSAAKESGLDPRMMHAIARIESSYNSNTVTGSYKGLFQLSEEEFRKNGGQGSIFDPTENARAAAKKLVIERKELSAKLGRPISDAELYMAHQQGVGGATQHLTHPERPAWESMYATGEGQRKGEAWAKRAIWGNLPPAAKAKFGSVENVKSGDFTEWWRQRYNRETGGKGAQEAGNFPSRGYETRRGEAGEFNVAKTGVYGPPGPANITDVTLKDGQVVQVNKAVAERYRGFLNDLIDRGYPLKVGAGSGYQYRANVNAPGSLSMHAYGAALDVNPEQNRNKGNTTNLPSDVEEMAWRRGLSWGGRFGDPMHFEPMSDAAWEHKKQLLRAQGKSDTPPDPSTTRSPADIPDSEKGAPDKGTQVPYSQYYFQNKAAPDFLTQSSHEDDHPINNFKVVNHSDEDISHAKTTSDNDYTGPPLSQYGAQTSEGPIKGDPKDVGDVYGVTRGGGQGSKSQILYNPENVTPGSAKFKQTMIHERGHAGVKALIGTPEWNEAQKLAPSDPKYPAGTLPHPDFEELRQRVADVKRIQSLPPTAMHVKGNRDFLKEGQQSKWELATGIAKDTNDTKEGVIKKAEDYDEALNKAAGKRIQKEKADEPAEDLTK
jgi:hypothetical protein